MSIPAQLAPYVFQPGNPGKPLGAINKHGKMVREAVAGCFEEIGGYEAFVAWAKKNRGVFYTKLWVKLLPNVENLPEEDKLALLRAMLAVQPVKTVLYEAQTVENPPSQSANPQEIVAPEPSQRPVATIETPQAGYTSPATS